MGNYFCFFNNSPFRYENDYLAKTYCRETMIYCYKRFLNKLIGIYAKPKSLYFCHVARNKEVMPKCVEALKLLWKKPIEINLLTGDELELDDLFLRNTIKNDGEKLEIKHSEYKYFSYKDMLFIATSSIINPIDISWALFVSFNNYSYVESYYPELVTYEKLKQETELIPDLYEASWFSSLSFTFNGPVTFISDGCYYNDAIKDEVTRIHQKYEFTYSPDAERD